jgi:2-iminobutanoate/2-iminopropanoate deaminase
VPKAVPKVPSGVTPIGPYSTATEAGGLVFISGQVAIDPVTGIREGGDAAAQAVRALENLRLVLGDLHLGFDDVVKTTIFLADIADFGAVNEVYGRCFGALPPARSTVQAGALPGGFLVEIEAIAARDEEG